MTNLECIDAMKKMRCFNSGFDGVWLSNVDILKHENREVWANIKDMAEFYNLGTFGPGFLAFCDMCSALGEKPEAHCNKEDLDKVKIWRALEEALGYLSMFKMVCQEFILNEDNTVSIIDFDLFEKLWDDEEFCNSILSLIRETYNVRFGAPSGDYEEGTIGYDEMQRIYNNNYAAYVVAIGNPELEIQEAEKAYKDYNDGINQDNSFEYAKFRMYAANQIKLLRKCFEEAALMRSDKSFLDRE